MARHIEEGRQLRMKLPMKRRHGGRREGAGRKNRSGIAWVKRVRRPHLGEQHPVHVNWRVRPEVWNLRSRRSFRIILRAFANAAERFGMRITHFSVMGNHLHLIVEANGKESLSRGMQGLGVRLARGLNRMMGRGGPVFVDRYHAHPLASPTEARNAVDYVMNNARIHAQRQGRTPPRRDDDYAVGPAQLRSADALWRRLGDGRPPVCEPESWLLTSGWKRARPAVAAAG